MSKLKAIVIAVAVAAALAVLTAVLFVACSGTAQCDLRFIIPPFASQGKPEEERNTVVYNQTMIFRPRKAPPAGRPVCVVLSIYNGNTERRQSVRETWLSAARGDNPHKHCIQYRFVGDPGRKEDERAMETWHPLKKDIDAETAQFNDLFSVPGLIGWSKDMTKRTMAFAEWVEEQSGWDYDYFVMVDADFFLCIDRLMFELQHRPRTKWMAGKLWCRAPDNTGPDEQLMMMSRDVIQHTLLQKKTIGLNIDCNPGQAFILWTAGTGLVVMNDIGIRHTTIRKDDPDAVHLFKAVCAKNIGVHHVNTSQMVTLWGNPMAKALPDKPLAEQYKVRKLQAVSKQCEWPTAAMLYSTCYKAGIRFELENAPKEVRDDLNEDRFVNNLFPLPRRAKRRL